MRLLKTIVSIFAFLICICFICLVNKYTSISPELIINSTSINNSGDQIIINYTLPNDFYSDSASGKYFYVGFEYPAAYRGAFEDQYASINQKAGTYWVSLPYTKELIGNISIMTHYEAAWGRGIDEYIYRGSFYTSQNP